MGTSHRHKPAGNPNWGKASKSITQISKDLNESNELSENPPKNLSPQKIIKRQSTLGKRISHNYHRAVRNLIRASGGRHTITGGSSRVMGRSGVYYAGAFTTAFQEIAEQGLSTWLKDKGVSGIEGKTIKEVIELLSGFMHDYFTGLDDTAAREALEAVNDMVEHQVAQNGGDFDKTFQEVVSSEMIKDYLDVFFGVYVYSHLSQAFSEKLQKDYGFEEANATMIEIKELIIDDVKRGFNNRPSGQIDWKGDEGKRFISQEFDRIIQILTNNED